MIKAKYFDNLVSIKTFIFLAQICQNLLFSKNAIHFFNSKILTDKLKTVRLML